MGERFRLELHDNPMQLEGIWRSFEETAFCTLFQSYAWLSPWCRTAALAHGQQPVIAVWLDDDGSPAIIWPMALSARHASRTLTWLGQGHSSYNMGLYRSDVVETLDADALRRMLDELASQLPGVRALHLIDQPVEWNGRRNPFARLPQTPSTNVGFEIPLKTDPKEFLKSALSRDTRRRLERMERRLTEKNAVEFGLADTEKQRLEMFSIFLRQRAAQFEQLGESNVFSPPAMHDFYRELYTQKSFESAYLKVGDQVVATSNGMKFQDRFYHLTLSMSLNFESDIQISPGRLLSREHIGRQCREGTAMFDFGPGRGIHKSAWHPREIAFIQTHLPLRPIGTPMTILRRTIAQCRYEILSSPSLQPLIRSSKERERWLRRLFAGAKKLN